MTLLLGFGACPFPSTPVRYTLKAFEYTDMTELAGDPGHVCTLIAYRDLSWWPRLARLVRKHVLLVLIDSSITSSLVFTISNFTLRLVIGGVIT